MRLKLLILVAFFSLGACSIEIPDFLGREGGGGNTYTLREDPPPDPVPVVMRTARIEHSVNGVIVRVDGLAPTQGFYAASLVETGGPQPLGPGVAEPGIMSLEFVATPPREATAVGPEATRVLQAGLFVPSRYFRYIRGFRVSGVNGTETLMLPPSALRSG